MIKRNPSPMKKIYFLLFFAIATGFSTEKAKAQCTANFSYTASGNTATFTDLSTAGIGTVVTWGWNFGDGGFSGSQNPVHTYTACGVYNVSLTIGTTAFCSNTYNATVTVSGGITPSFTYNVDTTSGDVSFAPSPLGLNHGRWNIRQHSFCQSYLPGWRLYCLPDHFR
jgi:PKD repeat protein